MNNPEKMKTNETIKLYTGYHASVFFDLQYINTKNVLNFTFED